MRLIAQIFFLKRIYNIYMYFYAKWQKIYVYFLSLHVLSYFG